VILQEAARARLTGVAGLAAAGAAAAALGLSGCGTGGAHPADPSSTVIAKVGDLQVTRGSFEAWMTETLGGPHDLEEAEAEVKSRLLDQFLDEELLLAEAGKQGITVTDEEARRQIPQAAAADGEPVAPDTASLKRSLLQKKFKEKVILSDVSVSDQEVRDYFESHPQEFRRPARAVLRKILLDVEKDAQEVHEELAQHSDQFEDIAEKRSMAPDGGQAQAYEEETLPEAVRAAAAKLKEGELSPVVKDPQGYFILRLEERQPARSPSLEEVREQIKLRMLRDKSQRRYADYVAGLRQRTTVEMYADRLGFDYTPPAKGKS
jgi:parvulin-like peptidyl-prolyl isomerase